jgi:hypothetical protein
MPWEFALAMRKARPSMPRRSPRESRGATWHRQVIALFDDLAVQAEDALYAVLRILAVHHRSFLIHHPFARHHMGASCGDWCHHPSEGQR